MQAPPPSGSIVLLEPTYPIARERIDIIHCPDSRTLEVKIRRRGEPLQAGQAEYVVDIKADGTRRDASAIESFLTGYAVMSSNVTLAGCPNDVSDIFSGEISYWLRDGDDATWKDRVFIRFYVRPGSVTAERVANIPTPNHLKRNGQGS
jgi:hypothetical protein